ncbi:hypothetical protein Patl1_24381 [Pistacia atlantica]|uniref:Uncharacterized protein n=1 Tax=Pistacia atlantica TaxID=434234 RepID=A0ACC0ZX49_9ROSI|nr:hypothetical protein Patl1_24381 [Pistacia atlantica]
MQPVLILLWFYAGRIKSQLAYCSLDFSSPDLETTPVVAKTKLAEATPPDNFTIDFSEYEDQNLGPEKEPDDENDTPQKVQAFRISFEQSPKMAKQDHDNGKTNGKARESDVMAVEFEEFCKAIEANLSIEQMVEILEVKDQDSSGPNPVVVTKWEMPIVNWNLMVKDILAKECTLIKKYQMTRKWDEKLGFEEDKGSEDNQNNANNATMDSCGEDCVEAVMVEKAGECLSFLRYVVEETELEASKEGRNLKDFKYGCFDYQYAWTIKIHELIRWIKKQNCPSVLGLRLDNALTSTANQLIPPTPATYTPPVEQPEVVIQRLIQQHGIDLHSLLNLQIGQQNFEIDYESIWQLASRFHYAQLRCVAM